MTKLELLVPPPVVALIVAAAMWIAASHVPPLGVSASIRTIVAIGLLAAGVGFDIAGLVSFRRAGTTVNPMRPAATSALVSSGVYGVTRNPMYLGLLLILVAWAVYLSSFWLLLGPLAFVLYMNRFQIGPEERALSARFGDDYAAYRVKVRRWL